MKHHHIYSPDRGFSSPFKLLKEILLGFKEGAYLGRQLFMRDLKAQFRGSFLGLAWAFVPPIVTTVIWVFLQGQKVFQVDDTPIPYPVFVLGGTILWSLFTTSLQKLTQRVTSAKGMLAKLNFPREALILAAFLDLAFDFAIKLILFFIAAIIFGVFPDAGILMLIPGLLSIFMLGFGINLILFPVFMLLQDVNRLIPFVIQFGFFLTPIIYPSPKSGIAQYLSTINPVVPLLNTTRAALTGQSFDQLSLFWTYLGIGGILTIIGLVIYKVTMPIIVERLGG